MPQTGRSASAAAFACEKIQHLNYQILRSIIHTRRQRRGQLGGGRKHFGDAGLFHQTNTRALVEQLVTLHHIHDLTNQTATPFLLPSHWSRKYARPVTCPCVLCVQHRSSYDNQFCCCAMQWPQLDPFDTSDSNSLGRTPHCSHLLR